MNGAFGTFVEHDRVCECSFCESVAGPGGLARFVAAMAFAAFSILAVTVCSVESCDDDIEQVEGGR